MKKLRFLVSLHTRENDFQVAQAKTAEETAHKLGSDVEIVFADNDAVNQSTQLLRASQSRVESQPDAVQLHRESAQRRNRQTGIQSYSR